MATPAEQLATLQEELRVLRAAPPRTQLIMEPPRSSSLFRAPNRFSGTDKTYSVQNFKTQLTIFFAANTRNFPNESDKVLFILSLLSGAALAYMEPFLPHIGTANAPGFFR